jgi:hypothetical protein
VRRADFERVGGYPRVGYGEDEAFTRLIGPAVVVDDARWETTLPTGVREIFFKARWIGRGLRDSRQQPSLWRFSPVGSVPAAVAHLLAGRARAAAARLIFDAGLCIGVIEARLRPDLRHHA